MPWAVLICVYNSFSAGCHQNKNAGIQTSLINDDPSAAAVAGSSQLSNTPGNSVMKDGK